jgi:hypothetical protein
MIRLPEDTTLRVAIYTSLACAIAGALYTLAEIEPAPVMMYVFSLAPPVLVILWLQQDARRHGFATVLDWGFFVWILWPVMIPWYAFKSRGRRGWRLLVGLLVLMFSPYIGALIAAALRGLLGPGA